MTSRKGGPWLANQALPYGRATASFVNSMPLPQRGRNVYSLVSKIFAKPQRGDIRAADVAPIGAWRFFVHKAINISPLWGLSPQNPLASGELIVTHLYQSFLFRFSSLHILLLMLTDFVVEVVSSALGATCL